MNLFQRAWIADISIRPSNLRRQRWVGILGLLLVLTPLASKAQEQTPVAAVGDPAYKDSIRVITSAIYDGVERWTFAVHKEHGWDLETAHGIEVQAGFVGEEVQRIIAKLWTDDGIYAIEFYRRSGRLLHTYETFEYFEEEAPKDAWRNFKGVAAWERRTYFDGDQVGYAEAKGRYGPKPGTEAAILQERLRHVLASLM